MLISGIQKLSLVDYPGKVCCVIFTQGCNLKCPFCHNSGLIKNTNNSEFNILDLYDFFEKRVGLIDGVCISGGEPTLQKDIKQFILSIKKYGYLIKLDTNGTNPDILRYLIESNIVDYVAMDVKNSFDKYSMTCGQPNVYLPNIKKSINYLKSCNIDYEFRTTVLKDYHTEQDMVRLAKELKGCKNYYIQKFVKSDNIIDNRCEELDHDTLFKYLQIVRQYIPNAEIRGIDLESAL